jgi:hypothetical protein
MYIEKKLKKVQLKNFVFVFLTIALEHCLTWLISINCKYFFLKKENIIADKHTIVKND